MGRDESVLGVKSEREGVSMSAQWAGSGCDWLRWSRRQSIRWRSSSKNGLGGGGGGGGGGVVGDLTGLLGFPRLLRAGSHV